MAEATKVHMQACHPGQHGMYNAFYPQGIPSAFSLGEVEWNMTSSVELSTWGLGHQAGTQPEAQHLPTGSSVTMIHIGAIPWPASCTMWLAHVVATAGFLPVTLLVDMVLQGHLEGGCRWWVPFFFRQARSPPWSLGAFSTSCIWFLETQVVHSGILLCLLNLLALLPP